MELDVLLSFFAGVFFGGGLLAIGILVGSLMNSGAFSRKIPEAEYDPTQVYSDGDFERALREPEDGGLEFPTDAQLEHLHRHSM